MEHQIDSPCFPTDWKIKYRNKGKFLIKSHNEFRLKNLRKSKIFEICEGCLTVRDVLEIDKSDKIAKDFLYKVANYKFIYKKADLNVCFSQHILFFSEIFN